MSLSYFDYIKEPLDTFDSNVEVPLQNKTKLPEPQKSNLSYFDYLKKEEEEEEIIETQKIPEAQRPKLSYFDYLEKPKKEISFGREVAYGVAQEPTAFGSLFRIGKAAFESFVDADETYEEARARIEKNRQEKILEEFPEFRGREETAGVLTGRAAVGLADPITFLVPWMKIAKAGKLASLGSAGTFAATDIALREEALYGEVRPEMVGLGFGLGVAGGAVGEVGMSLYRRAVNDKVTVVNKAGQKVDKDVTIKGATQAPIIKEQDIPTIEKLGQQTAVEVEKSLDNIGNLSLNLRKLTDEKLELSNSLKLIKKERDELYTKNIGKSYYRQATKLSKEATSLERKIKANKKQKDDINKRIEDIYLKEIPDNFLDVYSTSMLNGLKKGVLNENFARALTQELTRPLFGAIIGGGIGASFTEEDQGNDKMITFALLGATLGKFQKTIQSKSFELVPQKIKNAAGDEFISGFKRSWYNTLKDISAGSHIQSLMSWSDDVAVRFGARMYAPQGGGVTLGRTTVANPVENEAMLQLALWRDRASDMFSKYDDDVLILAGKISNQRGLASKKHSFLSAEDKLNPNFKQAEKLSREIDKYNNDFSNYMLVRGINFTKEDNYGLTQILKPSYVDEKNYAEVIQKLTKAFELQNKNIRKTLTAKQLKDKDFLEENYPTLLRSPKKVAQGYLSTATKERNNSLFSDKDDILFKTNNNDPLIKGQNTDFVLQAARHFDKRRTLFDQEARASVSELFENNPLLTTQTLTNNSIRVAEFAKQFGAKGEGIKDIFSRIDNRYKQLADPDNKYKTVSDLYANVPGVKNAATTEKNKIKESLETYFGVYGIEAMPTGDAARTFSTFLQTSLATTRLFKVAIPSTGDLMQTITNSGYGPAIRSAVTQIKASQGKALPLSTEGLGLRRAVRKPKNFMDGFLGRNRHDNILERELSDVLLIGNSTGARKFQKKMHDFTRDFFEVVQLGRITRVARSFAFDAGVFRTMDIARLNARGKTKEFLKSRAAIQKEIDTLGLTRKDIDYLSQFKTVESALSDATGKGLLKKAGMRAANRDAMIPLVGNRRLFGQTKNPYVKFLGSFLSWAQAKTSQTNALIARVEEGDIALFLKIAAALPVFASIRELQVSLSTNQKYREGVNDETLAQKVGEALSYSGLNTYGIDKIRGIAKYSDYGSSVTEQVAPVLGYMEDLAEIPFKGLPEFYPDEDEEMMEAFIDGLEATLLETADVLPIAREGAGLYRASAEDEDESILPKYATGGLVSGPEVPYTQEDPADRINPLTGEPYQEQMSRLGFAEGKEVVANRATRNNNPFNLVYGPAIGAKEIPWEGKVPHNPKIEDTFEVFEDNVMGFRAGIKNTYTHYNRGNNTVEKLIKIHAPEKGDIVKGKSENPNQEKFIKMVAKNLNVRPDEVINLNDPEVMKEYARSVAIFEGHENIKEEEISKALSLVEAVKSGGLGSSIEQQTQNN
tara:strand:- start:18534 stop:22931 length:4398 start_codon:yes stop_codon:yes gene_type:complete